MTGTEVKDAKAAVAQDDMGNNAHVVSLSLTKEGTEEICRSNKRLLMKQEKTALVFIMTGSCCRVCRIVQSEIKDGECTDYKV